MATANPFDLLGNDDNDDPSQLIAAATAAAAASKKPPVVSAPPPPAAAKMPTKPIPPSQAVREARADNAPARVNAVRGSFGRGSRGGRGFSSGPNREFGNVNTNGPAWGYNGGGGIGKDVDYGRSFDRDRSFPRERVTDGESGGYRGGPRLPYRGGGRRGGYGNDEAGDESERPARRIYERRSGTGRGSEMKRDGAGRGNWGTSTDDVIAQAVDENANAEEKEVTPEKQPVVKDEASDEADKVVKEEATNAAEEKEQEDKEMTLEEYEKVREEKRKALLALKAEERKVELDKELKSMQQLAQKKGNEEVFIKLGSDKDASRRKDNLDKEERVKKAVSINEFLKPAEGEAYHGSGGRGRGRGRGSFRGGYGGGGFSGAPSSPAPAIEDPSEFPSLGGK